MCFVNFRILMIQYLEQGSLLPEIMTWYNIYFSFAILYGTILLFGIVYNAAEPWKPVAFIFH